MPQAGAQSDQEDNIEDNLVLDNIAEKEEEETNTELLFDSARTRKEEVFDFIASHCPHVNPEGFYNYYQKLDWTQNGEPIKDWRRLAVTWEENMTKEAERLPFDEERKLWKQYEEKFGQKVPCQYFGIRWKYVQLAIATGVALKDE